MQKILLDTNVIIPNYWMEDPSFSRLCEYVTGTGAGLIVPRIVRQELVKNFAEAIGSVRNDFKNLKRGAERLHIPVQVGDSPDDGSLKSLRDSYEKWLENEFMRRDYVHDHDYRTLYLEELTADAIKGTKPGSQSVHYKDLLVWQAAKASALEYHEVCLLSDNWRDFAEGKKDQETLHRQLSTQIPSIGPQVRLFSGIPEFLASECPQVEGVTLEWFASQEISGRTIRLINDSIFDHEQQYSARARSSQSGIAHVSIMGLVTKPKYIIAQDEGRSKTALTVWFESQYEVKHQTLNDLSELRHKPVGFGMSNRTLLTTGWFSQLNGEITMDSLSLPFDW